MNILDNSLRTGHMSVLAAYVQCDFCAARRSSVLVAYIYIHVRLLR